MLNCLLLHNDKTGREKNLNKELVVVVFATGSRKKLRQRLIVVFATTGSTNMNKTLLLLLLSYF